MRMAHALPMRSSPQPTCVGRPRSRSQGETDYDVECIFGAAAVLRGSVSGPMSLICSNTDPGHPCVIISGMAFGCRERMWMEWMSTPSMFVVNCGKALSFASALRQS